MLKQIPVFLGKSGKIFGPFDQSEYNQMIAQGTLSNYNWIWEWKTSTWKPLEAPPPPIHSLYNDSDSKDHQSYSKWDQFSAVCFDQSHIIQGKIDWIADNGCALISKAGENGIPFPLGSKLELNLFDPISKKCHSVTVQVSHYKFGDKTWRLFLHWKEIPKFK